MLYYVENISFSIKARQKRGRSSIAGLELIFTRGIDFFLRKHPLAKLGARGGNDSPSREGINALSYQREKERKKDHLS